jgi:hypothetical protein
MELDTQGCQAKNPQKCECVAGCVASLGKRWVRESSIESLWQVLVVRQSITPVLTSCHRIHKKPEEHQVCGVASLVITELDSPGEDIRFESLQWSQPGATLSVEDVWEYLQILATAL